MANLSLLKELAKYVHLKLSIIMPFTESVSEKKERKYYDSAAHKYLLIFLAGM